MDALIDWLGKAVPQKLQADFFETAYEVGLLVLVIFSITQIVKISWRYGAHAKPPELALHLTSIATAILFALAMVAGDLGDKATVAAIAWLATWFLATYGMAIVKWKWPGLWQAINLDRRKPRIDDPTDQGHGLRDSDRDGRT